MLVHTECSRSNAYVLDLPENMGISNIVNFEDLTLCSNTEDVITNGGPNAHLPPTPRLKEEIEDVIDHQIVSTRGGGYQKYLIKWRGRLVSYCTWIIDGEFQHLNQDLYERFRVFNLSRSSFPRPGRVDRDNSQPPLKDYQRRKGVDSKAQALIWHSLDDNVHYFAILSCYLHIWFDLYLYIYMSRFII